MFSLRAIANMSLICHETVAVIKKFNTLGHYEKTHGRYDKP